jgi:hypothetical protein
MKYTVKEFTDWLKMQKVSFVSDDANTDFENTRNLPALTGTEKQIAWARNIRGAMLPYLTENNKDAQAQVEKFNSFVANPDCQAMKDAAAKAGSMGKALEVAKSIIEKNAAHVAQYEQAISETSAAWWIETYRNMDC